MSEGEAVAHVLTSHGERIQRVSEVIKKRFPNLNVREVVELTIRILLALEPR